jgi:hypothetical protein
MHNPEVSYGDKFLKNSQPVFEYFIGKSNVMINVNDFNLICRSCIVTYKEHIYVYYVKKLKLQLSLCLTKHHTMKTYWGSVGKAPRILDLDTRWR